MSQAELPLRRLLKKPMNSEPIISVVRLESDRMILRQTCRKSGASVELHDEPDDYVFVTVNADDYDEFESEMEVDDSVASYLLMEDHEDNRVYRVTKAPEALTFYDVPARLGGRTIRRTVRVDGWRMVATLPDNDALSEYNEICKERDVIFVVEKLKREDEHSKDFIELTDKQQAVLTYAYNEGYFDVPRDISQQGIADHFGKSKSAVSQIMRRAISDVCKNKLEKDNAIN